MKLNMQLRVSQTLAPQLIQSLKMLQMPLLKLEQTLRMELSTNPLLEEVDALDEAPETAADEEYVPAEVPNQDESTKEKVDWDDYLFQDDDGYKVRESRDGDEEEFEGTASTQESLYQHLLEQLQLLKFSPEDQLVGEYVIGNINPDGYLTISLGEMAAELQVPEEKVESILMLIQKFDPVGVGSRNLRESLLLQLAERGLQQSLAWRIVDEHLAELERKSSQQIARIIGVPAERVQKAIELIQTLSPTPAHGRFDVAAMPVLPDLIVERIGEEYVVFHNDRNMPRLRISAGYKDLIKRGNVTPEETKTYVRQKLEQARWLLNAINQRRSTMIRVMEAIVEEQHEFFDKGPAFLKPMIMEEIAQKVSMNVATISRVSSGKYVQTPLGVYEIKYFFNAGIEREDGEDLSKRTVKQRIEEIIRAENTESPLSDQEIFQALGAEGIKLARRTVTKYREELGLKPARFRKRAVAV